MPKVHLVKAMVFPVVMYGCESWTVKKAECWRIDAFELWCWKRLLRVPWTARRYIQSILNEINPEYSLEGLMLKLKLQYLGHLMQRADSFEKTLMLGKIEGRRRGRQRMRWSIFAFASLTLWIWVWVNSGSWWWTGRPGALRFMGSQRVGHNWATELTWVSGVQWRISYVCIRSDKISCSVVSDSLWPHESQHARPPCPSPTPGVHSDSRPSSQWCHPAISSSVIPFSSCPQSFPT